jgi:hypothetical protein
MREVAGSTPGLDFYLLREPIYVSHHLFLLHNVPKRINESISKISLSFEAIGNLESDFIIHFPQYTFYNTLYCGDFCDH